MENDILARLEAEGQSFSKGQKRIARFVVTNLEKAALMTAGTLGAAAEVSESTVVRFAVQLGYDGYPQMQNAMQNALIGRLAKPGIPENIELKNVADAIMSAHRIYLVAKGATLPIAEYMEYYLTPLFADVYVIPAEADSMGKLRHVSHGDCVLVFAVSPREDAVAEVAAYCHHTGATVIGITDSNHSPVCKFCNNTLTVNVQTKSFGVSCASLIAQVEGLLDELVSMN